MLTLECSGRRVVTSEYKNEKLVQVQDIHCYILAVFGMGQWVWEPMFHKHPEGFWSNSKIVEKRDVNSNAVQLC